MSHFFTPRPGLSSSGDVSLPPRPDNTPKTQNATYRVNRSTPHLVSTPSSFPRKNLIGGYVGGDELSQVMTTDMIWLCEEDLRDCRRAKESLENELQSERSLVAQLQSRVAALEEQEALLQLRRADDKSHETLKIHYQYEEKLRDRDRLAESLQTQLRDAEQRCQEANDQLMKRRQLFSDVGVQSGQPFTATAAQIETFRNQMELQKAHFEALIEAERETSRQQKQYWQEMSESKVTLEKESMVSLLESERQRWLGEKRRLEAAKQQLMLENDDREAKIADLEKQLLRLKDEIAIERRNMKHSGEALASLRQQMEDKIQLLVSQHSDEKTKIQSDFQRGLHEQSALYEKALHDEKERRKSLDEEVTLIRSDRSRIIGDHRAELKSMEQKLLATQAELTRRLEVNAALEEKLGQADRSANEKCREALERASQCEQRIAQVVKEKEGLASAVSDLEMKLQLCQSSQQKATQEFEAAQSKWETAQMSRHAQDMLLLEQRHREELESVRLQASGELVNKISVADNRYRGVLEQVHSLEGQVAKARADRDDVGRKLIETEMHFKLRMEDLEHQLRARNNVVQTTTRDKCEQAAVVHVGASIQTERALSDGKSTEGESAMEQHRLIWTLQNQLHESKQDVAFLEETVDALQLEINSLKGVGRERAPGGLETKENLSTNHHASVSPLRDEEKFEAKALFHYFHDDLSPTPPAVTVAVPASQRAMRTTLF